MTVHSNDSSQLLPPCAWTSDRVLRFRAADDRQMDDVIKPEHRLAGSKGAAGKEWERPECGLMAFTWAWSHLPSG
jgi:hypothetical protein